MTSLRSGVTAAWLLVCVIGIASSQGDDKWLVIEHGSGWLKVGWSSDAEPQMARNQIVKSPFTLIQPTKFGRIGSIASQKQVWTDVLKSKLDTSMQGQKVLLSYRSDVHENSIGYIENRLRDMGAAEVVIVRDATLAAKAHGLGTALVLQAGFHSNSAVAVINGVAETDTYVEYRKSGQSLTMELIERFSDSNYNYDQAEKFKKESCYVAVDYYSERRKNIANPDKFEVPELLFTPAGSRFNEGGVQSLVRDAINRSPKEFQEELWANVVIAGGSTLFPGFEQRLRRELRRKTHLRVNIHAAENRWATVWHGGKKHVSELL